MTKKPRNIDGRFLAKFSLGLLLVTALGWWGVWKYLISAPKTPLISDRVEIEIPVGTSVLGVGQILEDHHLIRSARIFQLYVKFKNIALQAGKYKLSRQSVPQLALALTQGRDEEVKLTIPEGYRIEQIAEVAGFDLAEFRIAAKYMEGQLFPDTYFVKKDITPKELVELMNGNYMKKVSGGNTRILTLASLIERETKHEEEKPIVAGIIEKRLAAGWPLELDATIQYWLGKPGNWWPNTTLADRQIKSPYNTYLNQGLPPNPICNPGLESINAAENPVDSPYWFYLHDPSGTIHYATTLAEHNLNIDKYLR